MKIYRLWFEVSDYIEYDLEAKSSAEAKQIFLSDYKMRKKAWEKFREKCFLEIINVAQITKGDKNTNKLEKNKPAITKITQDEKQLPLPMIKFRLLIMVITNKPLYFDFEAFNIKDLKLTFESDFSMQEKVWEKFENEGDLEIFEVVQIGENGKAFPVFESDEIDYNNLKLPNKNYNLVFKCEISLSHQDWQEYPYAMAARIGKDLTSFISDQMMLTKESVIIDSDQEKELLKDIVMFKTGSGFFNALDMKGIIGQITLEEKNSEVTEDKEQTELYEDEKNNR